MDWYTLVGNTLISSLIFNVYYPILEAFGYWALRILYRLIDRSFTCDTTKTKTISH